MDKKRPSVDPKKLSPDFGGSGPSVSPSPRWSPSRTALKPRGLFLFTKMQVAHCRPGLHAILALDAVVLRACDGGHAPGQGSSLDNLGVAGPHTGRRIKLVEHSWHEKPSGPRLCRSRESPRASAWCWQCIQNMKARHGEKNGDPKLEANTYSFVSSQEEACQGCSSAGKRRGRERRDRPRRSSGLSTPPRRP